MQPIKKRFSGVLTWRKKRGKTNEALGDRAPEHTSKTDLYAGDVTPMTDWEKSKYGSFIQKDPFRMGLHFPLS